MGDMTSTMPSNSDDTTPVLLTIAEAARYLNVPYGWLQVKVTKRAVPHTRLGKHVRFSPEHLAKIVADGEVVVPEEAPPAAPDTRLIPIQRRRRSAP